jgi:hypothetical protein
MPSEIVTNCDVCGVQKLGTNKWFLASSPANGRSLTVCHWTASKAIKQRSKSLCGHGCVHVVTDRFLATFTTKSSSKPATKEIVEQPVEIQESEQVMIPAAVEETEKEAE